MRSINPVATSKVNHKIHFVSAKNSRDISISRSSNFVVFFLTNFFKDELEFKHKVAWRFVEYSPVMICHSRLWSKKTAGSSPEKLHLPISSCPLEMATRFIRGGKDDGRRWLVSTFLMPRPKLCEPLMFIATRLLSSSP